MIIWGTRITRRRLGRVAEYCPLCRGPRPFRILRIGSVGHLYFLSLGSGRLLGHEAECASCGLVLQAEARDYSAVVTDPDADLAALEMETAPDLRVRHAERFALEERMRAGRLSPEQRRDLLREPFHFVHGMVERQRREQKLTPGAQLLGWGSLGILLLSIPFVGGPEREPQNSIGAVLMCLAILGLLVTLWNKATALRSFVRGRIEPLLARSLSPLDPTREELADALAHLRQMGMLAGKKLDADRIRAELDIAVL
ncbi:MAG: hypothetical protein ACT4PV_10225 [Planctomycetaceae bacterium]